MSGLPNGWLIKTIEEIQADYKGAIAIGPFGSKLKSSEYVESGIPVLRGNNFSQSGNIEGDFVFITEEKAKSLGNSNVYYNDLVFPHRGSIGEVGIIEEDSHFILSSSLMKLTCNDKLVDAKFLFYFFKSRLGKHELLKNASQVGTPGIGQPLSSLKSITIPYPPLEEQKSISGIITSFDKKIELLRSQNETLENIAQTLFKEWFVNFNYPNATGEMEDSEFGEIPKGWRVGTVKEIVDIYDSQRVPLSAKQREEKKGEYPYYGATKIMDYVDEYLFDGTYLLFAEDGSVMDDNGFPYLQYVWGKFWVNNHTHILQGKNGFSTELLYVMFKKRKVAGIVNGAVQLKINQTNLMGFEVIIPSPEVLEQFNNVIKPLFEKVKVNSEQLNQLSKTRDTLLPKLLNGSVRVQGFGE